jgi:hypothetical protein
MIVHATVEQGRFVIDETTELPDGTVVEMVVVEESFDDMPDAERATLLAQIDQGIEEYQRGEPGIPADEVLREIARRG